MQWSFLPLASCFYLVTHTQSYTSSLNEVCKQMHATSRLLGAALAGQPACFLNCNVFSRRLCSSASSNPSWLSSPSSCRPMANIMMETLSEHFHFLRFIFHTLCQQLCFSFFMHMQFTDVLCDFSFLQILDFSVFCAFLYVP